MPPKPKAVKTKAPKSAKAKGKEQQKPAKILKRAAEESDESEEKVDELDEEAGSGWSDVDDEDGSEDGSEEDEEDGDVDEEDEEDGDVDEDGMEKLMKALGEDGLDDFAREQLSALAGSGEEESEGSEGGEGAGSGEEEEADDDAEEQGDAEDEGEKDAAIAVDELSDAEMLEEDAMPQQKVEIDNQIAMERIRETIALDPSLPWTETLTVTYPETIGVDVDDDLNRELAFYKQALHCAQTARTLAQKHSLPFTRPADYFAEMVKSDSHMERIRQRLLDESAGLKRAEEKRKEREGKKFGKQVQLEKIKERQQSKKEVEERLKGLKRKRKGALDGGAGGDEDFDVAVEDAIADRPSKRTKGPNGKSKLPRTARDKKFGFGGAGRHSKQNTKDSTDSFVQRGGPGGKGAKGGKGGKGAKAAPKRPGKSRRMAQRSRT